ncbi:MAG: hypothetical protein ACR5K3_01405 [Wolbachia sp.]
MWLEKRGTTATKTGYAKSLICFFFAQRNKRVATSKQILNIDIQENLKAKSLMYIDKHLPAGNLCSNPTYTTVLSTTDAIIKAMKFVI